MRHHARAGPRPPACQCGRSLRQRSRPLQAELGESIERCAKRVDGQFEVTSLDDQRRGDGDPVAQTPGEQATPRATGRSRAGASGSRASSSGSSATAAISPTPPRTSPTSGCARARRAAVERSSRARGRGGRGRRRRAGRGWPARRRSRRRGPRRSGRARSCGPASSQNGSATLGATITPPSGR